MVLRCQKFGDRKLGQLKSIERIFTYYLFNLFFRLSKRQNNPPCSWHLTPGCHEYILLIVFIQKPDVLGHVSIELFKRNNVIKIDDEHSTRRCYSILNLTTIL